MVLIVGYILLICIEIVTPISGRRKSVYQRDLSDICKRRIVSSVFLGSGVLETDSETLDFSKLELPYDCYVKVKAEPGSKIILVAQIESAENLKATCEQKPNQFLVLDMLNTFGGFWEMLANDFSTPDYKQQKRRRTWSIHNYHTPPVDLSSKAQEAALPIPTSLESLLLIPSRTQTFIYSKSTQNLRVVQRKTSQVSKSVDKTDHKGVDINANDEKKKSDRENSTGARNCSVNLNLESFEKQDDYKDKDLKDDEGDSDTEEDYLEEESSEEIMKVPNFSTAHNILLPHLRETPKPHIYFVPRYKNILSPKRPQTRGEYSDLVDDRRLDYLWKTTKKPRRMKVNSNSSVQYLFKIDEDRKRVTPNLKMLSFRTRLRYFHDDITNSMKSTAQVKQLIEVPYFKPKSSTGNRFNIRRNKLIKSKKKDILNSTEAANKNGTIKFPTAKIQTTKKIAAQSIKQHKLMKDISTKLNISRHTTLQNKIVTTRKRTTNAETGTFIITPTTTSVSIRTSRTQKRNETKIISTSNLTPNTSSLTESSTKMDITPFITVTSHRSDLAVTPIKSMKSSEIASTTTNEHDFLKQLLTDFRIKANNVPHKKISTANIRKATLSTANIKPEEQQSPPSHTISKTTLMSTFPIDQTLNKTALSTAITVSFNTSIRRTIEPTKKDKFQTTNITLSVQSLENTIWDTSLRNTTPLKTLSSEEHKTFISVTYIFRPVSLGKITELPSLTVKTATTLNMTRQTNASLKSTATQSDFLNLLPTKSIISPSKYTLLEKENSNFKTIKEEVTKPYTKASSKKYQTETKIIQENNVSSTNLTTKQSSTKINRDSLSLSEQLDVIVDKNNTQNTTSASTQKEEENNTQNVIPLQVNRPTSSKNTVSLAKASKLTQTVSKTKHHEIQYPVTTEMAKHEKVSPSTVKTTTLKESDIKSSQVKLFVAAKPWTTRKSVHANFSGGFNVTKAKPKNVTLFSAETWHKSTLAYKSWENLIQAAPDMISSLNRTKHIWKAKLKKAKTPKAKKRIKRRIEYIPIEDSKPHTQEVLHKTSKKPSRHTAGMNYYLADDQMEEDFGRAHFGRLESYLGPVIYNICSPGQKKTRLVSLLNTSTIILIMNDFNLERLNLIVTSATVIAQTLSQCPQNQLECQVSGVRVCIDMSSACDHIPNCGAYDIYDEDRILCGFNISFKHSLVLTAVTFVVMIGIGVYSIHYWLKRCIPQVSEAFFVYTDTAENVLYLDTIMRSPNATDEFPPMPYHATEFEDGLRMRKRMVKRGLCRLLFGIICPCCKIFKPTAEAPISLEEFDKDHSEAGSHFDKMFQYSSSDMDKFPIHQDDKATQTSFALEAVERAVSFHSKYRDSLINKLEDLRSSRSYHMELELINKMRDNTEVRKEKRSYSKDDSSSYTQTQRVTADEEELRNTVYDMGIPVSIPAVLLSKHDVVGQSEEEIEGAFLAEPTKRLRFNEHKAGTSEVTDKDKAKKPIDNKLMSSVDFNKKKTNSKFTKFLNE